MKNRSFGGHLRELAIFTIAVSLLGHYLRIPIDLLKISAAFVEQLDQTIIERQGLRVRLIDLRQAALLFETIIKLESYWVGKKECGECLGIGVQEDVFGIFM